MEDAIEHFIYWVDKIVFLQFQIHLVCLRL